MNATDADYASLTNSINNCTGAAQRVANVKLDNLNGQLTLMDSAWDALKTTIGEEFNPELRALAEIATDILNAGNEFMKENPALVKAAMTFVGIIGTAVAGMTAYAAITKVAQDLNVAALFTGPAGAALGAVAGVAAVTAAVVGFVTAANEGVPSVKELTEAAREMTEAMEAASDTYNETMTATLATAQVADTYIAKLEELGEGTEAVNDHSQMYLNTLALLCNAVPELSDYVDLQTGTIEGGTTALREYTDAWKKTLRLRPTRST